VREASLTISRMPQMWVKHYETYSFTLIYDGRDVVVDVLRTCYVYICIRMQKAFMFFWECTHCAPAARGAFGGPQIVLIMRSNFPRQGGYGLQLQMLLA
jgi:hypothetical protein